MDAESGNAASDAFWSFGKGGGQSRMRRSGVSLIDLRSLDEERLIAALGELGAMAHAVGVAVVDLGPRRVLDARAVAALLEADRAITSTGGRCAWVTVPALAAQISLAHPDGILFT